MGHMSTCKRIEPTLIGLFLILFGLFGCSAPSAEEAPAAIAAPAPPARPSCAYWLSTPVQTSGVSSNDTGICDVSPYDGEPGDQFFELFSGAGGVHVRAAISRNAPQGVPLPIDRAQVAAWDWTANCSEWTGVAIWRDDVTHDPDHAWIEHHEWSVSLDLSCLDNHDVRIIGTYEGYI